MATHRVIGLTGVTNRNPLRRLNPFSFILKRRGNWILVYNIQKISGRSALNFKPIPSWKCHNSWIKFPLDLSKTLLFIDESRCLLESSASSKPRSLIHFANTNWIASGPYPLADFLLIMCEMFTLSILTVTFLG